MIWLVWWAWVVGGLVIATAELLLPGYVFLGFAVGAVTTGVLLWAGLSVGLPALLVIFALVSLAAWLAMRKLFGLPGGSVKVWDRDINDN